MSELPPKRQSGPRIGSWDDVLLFVVVAQEQSFSGASRVLNIDRTTVGRRIAGLEARLGDVLFVRQGTHLDLTTFGEEALIEARKIAHLVSDFEWRLGNGNGTLVGRIRISSTEGVGSFWLLPRLRSFQAANPRLEIELLASDSLVVLGRDADIAIRMARPSDLSHVAKRVGTIGFKLFATRRYLDEHGSPSSIDDLANRHFIDHSGYPRNPELSRWNTLARGLPVRLRTDSAHGLMQAVRAGYGIAMCPTYAPIIAEEIGCTDLVQLDIDFEVNTGVWVVYHEDQRHRSHVMAMVNELYRLFVIDIDTWFPKLR